MTLLRLLYALILLLVRGWGHIDDPGSIHE